MGQRDAFAWTLVCKAAPCMPRKCIRGPSNRTEPALLAIPCPHRPFPSGDHRERSHPGKATALPNRDRRSTVDVTPPTVTSRGSAPPGVTAQRNNRVDLDDFSTSPGAFPAYRTCASPSRRSRDVDSQAARFAAVGAGLPVDEAGEARPPRRSHRSEWQCHESQGSRRR